MAAYAPYLALQLRPIVCVAQVLEILATSIERDIGALMHNIDHVQAGLHIFDFLGNAVLAEADKQLASAMPGAYAGHCASENSEMLIKQWNSALGGLIQLPVCLLALSTGKSIE